MGIFLGLLATACASVLATLVAVQRELLRRWGARMVDRIDHSLRRRTTRFGQRYHDYLLSSVRFIDLKGLATLSDHNPKLDEVFVDVSLVYRAPHLVEDSVLAQVPPEVTERRSIDEFLCQAKPATLAIVGGPGSGKTTLLRHTAQTILKDQKSHKRPVPMLLYLRDHVTTITNAPESTIPDLVRTSLGDCGTEPPGWFEQQLRDGRCVILLDGLDEVAREEDRRQMSNWVERQTKSYPQNDFVITSRPQGYRSASIAGADVLQVRSFTEQQISRFVHSWYLAMEKHSTDESSDEIRIRAEAASNDLLERLEAAPALHELTINPLLLTMIANVHRHRGALPGSRSDLYSEICQVMLWRRHEAKDIPLNLNGDKKEVLLRSLAFRMMEERVRDLPRTAILRDLKSALRRISTRLTEEDFLADVTSNGLLIERESGMFAFAHLTFQEYLASAYIRDKGCVETLVAAVDDIWWRETTLLYTAKSDADPIVRACLQSSSVTALMLALDCADQESELAPELRDELDKILDSKRLSAGYTHARAGLLVARYLRQFVHTASGSRVCTLPISGAIYAMFVAANPAFRLASFWNHREEPVTGVYDTAATAFVAWANSVTDSEPAYRLPSVAEITDPAVQRSLSKYSDLAFWTSPDIPDQPPVLWTPGAEHPHVLSRDVLLKHVTRDLSQAPFLLDKLYLIRSHVILTALNMAFTQDRAKLPADLAEVRMLVTDAVRKPTAFDRALCLKNQALYEERVAELLNRRMGRILAYCLRRAAEYIPIHATARATPVIPDNQAGIHALIERVVTTARGIARDRVRDLDSVLDSACAQMMGQGVTRALLRTRRTSVRATSRTFADSLLTEAGVVQANTVAPLDILHVKRPQSSTTNWWARDVIANLDQSINTPAIQSLDERTAPWVRLPALCLAAELTDEPRVDRSAVVLSDWMTKLATGVTLLERRATGQARASEGIMLATS